MFDLDHASCCLPTCSNGADNELGHTTDGSVPQESGRGSARPSRKQGFSGLNKRRQTVAEVCKSPQIKQEEEEEEEEEGHAGGNDGLRHT